MAKKDVSQMIFFLKYGLQKEGRPPLRPNELELMLFPRQYPHPDCAICQHRDKNGKCTKERECGLLHEARTKRRDNFRSYYRGGIASSKKSEIYFDAFIRVLDISMSGAELAERTPKDWFDLLPQQIRDRITRNTRGDRVASERLWRIQNGVADPPPFQQTNFTNGLAFLLDVDRIEFSASNGHPWRGSAREFCRAVHRHIDRIAGGSTAVGAPPPEVVVMATGPDVSGGLLIDSPVFLWGGYRSTTTLNSTFLEKFGYLMNGPPPSFEQHLCNGGHGTNPAIQSESALMDLAYRNQFSDADIEDLEVGETKGYGWEFAIKEINQSRFLKKMFMQTSDRVQTVYLFGAYGRSPTSKLVVAIDFLDSTKLDMTQRYFITAGVQQALVSLGPLAEISNE